MDGLDAGDGMGTDTVHECVVVLLLLFIACAQRHLEQLPVAQLDLEFLQFVLDRKVVELGVANALVD